MYDEWFSHMNKSVQRGISFYLKFQIVQVKMNLPIYSLIFT